MKFYKSFLFLFVLNSLFILPVWLFLNLRFLIPAFVCLFILNLFLLFFISFYLRKKFSFSVFASEDPYGVSFVFEELKAIYNLKNIQLLKIKQLSYSFFYFNGGKTSFVVLSEDLLENFSKEDIKRLLTYPFQMIKGGDLLFLTLLGSFLFLIEKALYFLNHPFFFFKKKPIKKENFILVLVLKALSVMTKKIFYRLDTSFLSKGNNNKKQALLLWKLHGLAKTNPPKISPFLAPLFLTNPLTNSAWECYISLQPLIKDRVKSLIGVYPP